MCAGTCLGGTGLCCQDLHHALALCLVRAKWGAQKGKHHHTPAIHSGKHSISNFRVFKCCVNGHLPSPKRNFSSTLMNQKSPKQICRLQQQPQFWMRSEEGRPFMKCVRGESARRLRFCVEGSPLPSLNLPVGMTQQKNLKRPGRRPCTIFRI